MKPQTIRARDDDLCASTKSLSRDDTASEPPSRPREIASGVGEARPRETGEGHLVPAADDPPAAAYDVCDARQRRSPYDELTVPQSSPGSAERVSEEPGSADPQAARATSVSTSASSSRTHGFQ
jgi:hypothetical protein